MIDKIGPGLTWLLFLLGCQAVIPQAIPFILYSVFVAGAIWMIIRGWQLEHPKELPSTEPPHTNVLALDLKSKPCYGTFKRISYRKLESGKFEDTEQCQKCGLVRFRTNDA